MDTDDNRNPKIVIDEQPSDLEKLKPIFNLRRFFTMNTEKVIDEIWVKDGLIIKDGFEVDENTPGATKKLVYGYGANEDDFEVIFQRELDKHSLTDKDRDLYAKSLKGTVNDMIDEYNDCFSGLPVDQRAGKDEKLLVIANKFVQFLGSSSHKSDNNDEQKKGIPKEESLYDYFVKGCEGSVDRFIEEYKGEKLDELIPGLKALQKEVKIVQILSKPIFDGTKGKDRIKNILLNSGIGYYPPSTIYDFLVKYEHPGYKEQEKINYARNRVSKIFSNQD